MLQDTILSYQNQPPIELALATAAVSTGGSIEATFVSGTSSDVTLGSEIIKANTTCCGATKLVISLTTSTLVSAFAVDAILKVEADN